MKTKSTIKDLIVFIILNSFWGLVLSIMVIKGWLALSLLFIALIIGFNIYVFDWSLK